VKYPKEVPHDRCALPLRRRRPAGNGARGVEDDRGDQGLLDESRGRPAGGRPNGHGRVRDRTVWRTQTFPPHWVGTTVRWDVEPRDDGSTVSFRHAGFTDDAEAGMVAYTWGQIMVRLKEYAESGRPNPLFT
jgi:hypothetical protein